MTFEIKSRWLLIINLQQRHFSIYLVNLFELTSKSNTLFQTIVDAQSWLRKYFALIRCFIGIVQRKTTENVAKISFFQKEKRSKRVFFLLLFFYFESDKVVAKIWGRIQIENKFDRRFLLIHVYIDHSALIRSIEPFHWLIDNLT